MILKVVEADFFIFFAYNYVALSENHGRRSAETNRTNPMYNRVP